MTDKRQEENRVDLLQAGHFGVEGHHDIWQLYNKLVVCVFISIEFQN